MVGDYISLNFNYNSNFWVILTPRYILREWGEGGEIILDGAFFPNELSKVSKNVMEEEFKIEKVLETRGKGRKKQLFVKWLGWPEKYNSWIYQSTVSPV